MDVASIISEPKYAAGIAAVIGIIAKYIDNRLTSNKDKPKSSGLLGYLKSAVYSAALVGFFVFLLKRFGKTTGLSDSGSTSGAGGYSLGGGGGYSLGGGGGYSSGGGGGYSSGGGGGYSSFSRGGMSRPSVPSPPYYSGRRGAF